MSGGTLVLIATPIGNLGDLSPRALEVLRAVDPSPARAVEGVVLVTSSLCATVTRYLALRSWVFARRGRLVAPGRPAAALASDTPTPGSSA